MEISTHAWVRCVDVDGEEVDLASVVAGVFGGDLLPGEFTVTLERDQPPSGRED